MRLIKLDSIIEKDKLIIDLAKHENFAVIVSNGEAKMTPLPEHGETKIVTSKGKVTRVKWNEGELFN
ncbi:XtrA/YqaO family protein [Bacillus atrophaeus]|uniref:XtrA/YqaO family protein n=1 Tax=Bacillus atrophaeus TaxID=1452 RepID=UPI00227EEBA2|nr:XtrA/YqaO family protein [Bacillus atrophaeus]MCY8842447.1 XtrA/YqaO family protein [Bacillus atrophaeus]MEC0804657.1 XtrA/YqaO family protein [Bacillus atrophaeus]MEC0852574.1 XtrA/YqaO family protein [Bacillus atrophaeus]MEC0859486.1 XtrA/YqaO family protein [Bacillus atrophaeus]MEC0862293.1 XtrA/YqaO family protein [Bacillus atrophaeus]